MTIQKKQPKILRLTRENLQKLTGRFSQKEFCEKFGLKPVGGYACIRKLVGKHKTLTITAKRNYECICSHQMPHFGVDHPHVFRKRTTPSSHPADIFVWFPYPYDYTPGNIRLLREKHRANLTAWCNENNLDFMVHPSGTGWYPHAHPSMILVWCKETHQ